MYTTTSTTITRLQQYRLSFTSTLAILWMLAGCTYPAALPTAAPPQPATQHTDQPNRTIVVVGNGDLRVQANIVQISFGISVVDDTVLVANRTANDTMQRVLDTLASLSITKVDITPYSYGIWAERYYPEYEADDPGTVPIFPDAIEITRYRVTHQTHVVIRDLDRVPNVINALTQVGGDNFHLYATAYLYDDPASLEGTARQKAVADAQHKAAEIASLLGVELRSAIHINEFVQGSYHEFTPFTTLWPGQLQFYKQLQIEYAVE